MADYYNLDEGIDVVNVSMAVGRKAKAGPAPNTPTDIQLVYFFLYRLFCHPPKPLTNKKISSLINVDPRVVNWAEPSLPKKIGDAVYTLQNLHTNYLYPDGRIDRMTETLITPRTRNIYTILYLQTEYTTYNPLYHPGVSIGEIMVKDLLVPRALRTELFGMEEV